MSSEKELRLAAEVVNAERTGYGRNWHCGQRDSIGRGRGVGRGTWRVLLSVVSLRFVLYVDFFRILHQVY